ncbi:MAG: malonyl-CoA synthase [Rhodobacteraceae bacterium]|nr:malonyl-CoA synthase [Paracoccaceae bacterium]
MANPLYDALFGVHAGRTTPFLYLPDGQMITHRDFLHTASQIANVMAKLGLRPGDRVAAQVQKSTEALALYAACAQAGMVFLPLNTDYTADELTYFIEDSGASLILCDSGRQEMLAALATRLGIKLETLNADGSGSLMKKAADMNLDFATVDRNDNDLAALLYTSGTTGRSKGAMLTQANLLSNARTLVQTWRFSKTDVLLHALPIFHTHGLFVAVNVTLIAGSSMVFMPKFDVDQIIKLMPKATAMMGVPTFYTRLLGDDRFVHALTSHMRLFVSGSAPLLAETHIQFEKRTGHRILERYGMTETNMNASNPYDGERRAGTVGFPLPGVEIKITDPVSGNTLATDRVGQIEVRGANVFAGYWRMPEKTAAELREDGFFITGDLGKIDSDGYVHIVGRNKDLIISGGYNIYPKEVELVLDDQSGILESAVIGVPHPDFGESVVGIIIPEKGHSPDLEKAMEAVRQSLARFKHPRELIILKELPRNTMGKVQKNVLRDQYQTMFAKA